MRVRFSTVLGMAVAEEDDDFPIGRISGMLLDPDSLRIEGFFVRISSVISSQELFLGQEDIAHWGTMIRVRDADVLGPLEERVRLARLSSDPRTVLRQKMQAENGRAMGICADVQFDTSTCSLEWLFPRRWLRWHTAVPASSVLRITPDAIIIRDAALIPLEQEGSVLSALDPLARTPAQSRSLQNR